MAGVAVDLTCRPLVASDLPAVMEIEAAAFVKPWSAALFADELVQPSRRYIAAEAGDSLCGYGGIMLVGEDATVLTLAVAPAWRELGVASRILLELIDVAREDGAGHITLEVRESNLAALDLYAKFGFQTAGTRKRYYGTEDAVVMWAVDIASPEYQQRVTEIREEASWPTAP